VLSRLNENGRWRRLSLVVERGEGVMDGMVESVGSGEGVVGEIMLLEVAPASLDVIQLGGVFRQSFEGEPGALGERAGCQPAAVDRSVVENRYRRALLPPFAGVARPTLGNPFGAVGAPAVAARSPARRGGQSRHTGAPASSRHRGACLRSGSPPRSPRHATRSRRAVWAPCAATPPPHYAQSTIDGGRRTPPYWDMLLARLLHLGPHLIR
jgi:hypothetical protein